MAGAGTIDGHIEMWAYLHVYQVSRLIKNYATAYIRIEMNS